MLVWVGANTSWLWVTQISTSYCYPCLLVWFWTGHLMSLITCFFTSRVEMTILLHHRAMWKITWDKTCIGTYMRVAQFSSVMQSCPTLCDPMDVRPPCPSPTLELTQTHVHWVGGAMEPSHPLSSPSPTFNLSQHQGLFQWVSSSHQVANVSE